MLGQARPPGALAAIDAALQRDGFTPDRPDRDGYARRYVREGLVPRSPLPDLNRATPYL